MGIRTIYIVGAAAALTLAGGAALYWPYVSKVPGSMGAAAAGDALKAPDVVQPGTAPPPPAGSEIEVNPSGTHVDASVISQAAPPPQGYIEYRDTAYGFSFYHGTESQVKVYDEGSGAETVVVENFQKQRGFQIFIVPYAESAISEARFHQDVPSGVRDNIEKATLDGVESVTFNSSDETLGPTREIWTIHGGYLYEITTFSGVGGWFTPIIQSWRWI
jgi:hypothetical protein